MKYKILLIEDEETFHDAVELMLAKHPIEVVWASTGAKGIQIYKQTPHAFAVVLIDYMLPDLRGTEVCPHLRRLNPEQIFLFTSKHFDPEYLKDQLRVGSNGFVDKSSPTEEMRGEILRAVQAFENEYRLVGQGYEQSKAERALEAHGMVGKSQVMYDVLQATLTARDSNSSTLIIGESGTGKELIARALVPVGKKLISVTGAAWESREGMLEAELFGHTKGAFTDAKNESPGLIMQAHRQALFFDEMHRLSISGQAKLLRFLEEMKFRRVGDHSGKELSVDFKLISAVQPDIKQRIQDGRFIIDLIERIGGLVINVPPLRERTEDIECLVHKFQDEFNRSREPGHQKQFRISTIHDMQSHAWPTNVRGLKNAVNRMLTACRSDIVNPVDFQNYLRSDPVTENPVATSLLVPEAKTELEQRSMKKALQESYTRIEAAARTGIPMTSFLRKLERFGIDADLYLKQT